MPPNGKALPACVASRLLYDKCGRHRAIRERQTVIINPPGVTFTPRLESRKTRMKIRSSGKSGFTLKEIIIVVTIIGLLAGITISNFFPCRTTAQQNACINNLRQIDGAKQQWALELKEPATATPAATDIHPFLGRGNSGTLPSCPSDSTGVFTTSYTVGNVQVAPVCRINTSNHVLM